VFKVTEERFNELNSTMHGALVEPVEESKEELKLEAEEEEQPDG